MKRRLAASQVTQNQVDEWIGKWKFFFILGFGRSGTAFMANLLNQAPEAYVIHEPVFEDFLAHVRAHYNPNDAEKYMQGFRKKEIYTRTYQLTPGVYGEVNGNLRCHAHAIKKAFPDAPVLHIVRDGREVIRSHMSRRTMTFRNPFSMSVHPIQSDRWHARWPKMDRFARICWYWQEENARLRASVGRMVHFEKILSSYEYFSTEILEPCQVHIEKKDWEVAINHPRNITSHFQMPKWDDWTSEQQQTFREICGDEMTICGYTF